jgi:acetone monooxygenase
MNDAAAPPAAGPTDVSRLDALVIGGGIAGMYQLYRLRELGLQVKAVEAGDDVGGTWYWNRYPGARVDPQSHVYQYWFSQELNNEWSWSERFPAQPEIERYLNFVADRFDLRKDILLKTRVMAAGYDDSARCWSVTTEKGETFQAR